MADSPFVHRGVVEGYYGPPCTDDERRHQVDRLAAWGMNTYVVAPKDDPLQRDRWREPYPEAERAAFAALVRHGEARGVRVGFAISPGLSIAYGDEADRRALFEKFAGFVALGARFLCLALDDVPSELEHEADRARYASLADAHVDVANALHATLPADATLWVVPTDYAGTHESPYLATLGAGLAAGIEVGWTGRSVVSPEIRVDEARARARALRRRLLVWDNYPVADGPMRNVLHLAPYRGRDAALAEHVSGFLLNPMEHARASAVGLETAAVYMADPAGYDPEAAWRASVRRAGAGAPEAFETFAAGHRFSALSPEDRDHALETAWSALRAHLDAGDHAAARREVATLRGLLDARGAVAATLRERLGDRVLLEEIEPWIEAHARGTRALVEATDLLAALADDVPAMALALAFFRMEGRLTRLPPAARCSYGPRRQVYPQLARLDDDGARFSDDPALYLDRHLADAFVRDAGARALARLGGRVAPPIDPA